MSFAGYLRITRPVNAGVAGVSAAVAFWMCGGTELIVALLLFLAVTAICGAGNAVNDCFDADIDRINRPDRPIPAGKATVPGTIVLTVVLFTAGFLFSLPILPWCPALAAVNILLLIMYSTSFKRMPVLGNICVAYLTGSVFLFGGMAVGEQSFLITAPLFLVTFFGTLAREIIKDAEDMEGDRKAGAYTLPMLVGVRASSVTAVVCMICAVLSSYLPAVHWGISYVLLITAVNIYLLRVSAKALSGKTAEEILASKAARYMKYGMFAAILVFFVSSVLTRFIG